MIFRFRVFFSRLETRSTKGKKLTQINSTKAIFKTQQKQFMWIFDIFESNIDSLIGVTLLGKQQDTVTFCVTANSKLSPNSSAANGKRQIQTAVISDISDDTPGYYRLKPEDSILPPLNFEHLNNSKTTLHNAGVVIKQPTRNTISLKETVAIRQKVADKHLSAPARLEGNFKREPINLVPIHHKATKSVPQGTSTGRNLFITTTKGATTVNKPIKTLKMASSSSANLNSGVSLTQPGTEKQPWPNSKDDYELRDVIGVGATAVVHAALCIPRKEKCAIKRINLEKWNTSMDELLKEIQAMSSCNHENVVTYHTSFVVREELWLVLRLLEGGSLLDIIKHKMRTSNCKHGVFDEPTIATVLKEVLKGLEYFHSNGQIHRDIKAGNILIGDDGTIQIADFGVSAWLATGRDLSREKVRHTFVGTPCWMAPEVMEQDHGYDFKADIWSFGITAIEMATGTAPYHKYPPMKVLMLTLQNDPPTLDTGADEKDQYKAYGKTFRKMIVECLQKEPSKRPTASELLKHAFFKKAKDRKYLTQTLLASGPSMETRVHKAAKRQPGASGRLHRTVTGEWVWSSEEEDNGGKRHSSDSESDDRPINRLERADSSDSDRDDPSEFSERTTTATETLAAAQNASAATITPGGGGGQAAASKTSGNASTLAQATASIAQMPMPSAEGDVAVNNEAGSDVPPVNLVLRMRNVRRELHDIRFEFAVGKDSADGIANELVDAGLVDPLDTQPMTLHLQQLIDQRQSLKTVTFQLNSGVQPGEVPDDRSLVGYAQISITD